MKKEKGTKGYRRMRKKRLLIYVSVCGAAIILQLLARFLIENQATKNILMVMAILTVLPLANLAAPMLASWRYRQPAEDFYQEISKFEQKSVLLYELIITSKELIMPVDAAAVHPQGIFLYCPVEKLDTGKAEAYFNQMLTGQKLDPHAKVFKDKSAFIRRLESLKPAAEYEDDGSIPYAVALLKNLSM